MLFDMKGKSEASFLYGVKILTLNRSPLTTGHLGGADDTVTFRAGKGAIYSIHMSVRSCF